MVVVVVVAWSIVEKRKREEAVLFSKCQQFLQQPLVVL